MEPSEKGKGYWCIFYILHVSINCNKKVECRSLLNPDIFYNFHKQEEMSQFYRIFLLDDAIIISKGSQLEILLHTHYMKDMICKGTTSTEGIWSNI